MIFATSNIGKFQEAQKLMTGVKLVQRTLEVPELQSDSLTEIAAESAKYAYTMLREPCFVEDSGLFVTSLKGFPGPYSKYVYYTIGLGGILKLVEGDTRRQAEFRSVIGYATADGVKTFSGTVRGTLAEEPRGSAGFGYDPIFIPYNSDRTFAEDPDNKDRVSHRAASIKAFMAHLGLHG
jgi:XTP/dITP diphosphohydrolase